MSEAVSEDRKRLMSLVDEIAASAKERILDPKNVAKGDGWRDMRDVELIYLLRQERKEVGIEFQRARMGWEHNLLYELGDELVLRVMQMDKLREEKE